MKHRPLHPPSIKPRDSDRVVDYESDDGAESPEDVVDTTSADVGDKSSSLPDPDAGPFAKEEDNTDLRQTDAEGEGTTSLEVEEDNSDILLHGQAEIDPAEAVADRPKLDAPSLDVPPPKLAGMTGADVDDEAAKTATAMDPAVDQDNDDAIIDTGFVDRIRTFNRFITQKMGLLQEGYSQSKMSLTEARLLYELAQGDGPNARDLCRRLDLDPGYVSRVLKKFERNNLLVREKADEDKRQSILALTETGLVHFAALERITRKDILREVGDVQGMQREKAEAAMATLESLFSGDRGFPGPVFVRSLEPGDLGWVVQSHGSLYATEYGFDLTFEALVAEIVANFAKSHDRNVERAWIAESNGERVGSVFLVRETDDVARLRLLLIDPQVRGIGLGKQLVRNCINFARQAGYRTMTLWTQQNLQAARIIYQQNGFFCVKTEENLAFGQRLISETWELDLTSEA